MTRCYRCLGVSVALLVMTTAGLRAQSQSATAVAPGTLPLANIAPEARTAIEAAIDANQAWLFFTAFEQAGKALAIDSTLGIARSLQAALRGGPTAAAEHRRALADATGRPVPELSLILATRAAGANRATLLTAVKTMLPNDRRIALDYALTVTGTTRLDSLRALTTRFPDFAPAKIWLAYYLTFTAYPTPSGPEADEALRVAQQAVQQAPEMSGTHAALGHVLERLGRHEEALRHLHQATSLSPHNEPAYVLKAEIFIREAKVALARAALDSAIMVTPNVGRQVDHRENRAVALLHEGNVKQMLDELAANARAAEANGQLPAAAAVHMTMAVVSAGARDAASALAHHAEAKRLNLAAGTLADGEVVMYFLLGRAEDARRALGDYIRLAAGQAANVREENIHRMTGLTLVAEGKGVEAIVELKQGGANPYAQLGIIEAYLLQGKNAEAQAERTALLARKDVTYASTAVPIARYRGVNRARP